MSLQVFRASAGSGKTFTLVKEYLKIILSSETPYKFRNILAITFTNKAASEMKQRVLSTLKGFSSEVPDKSSMQMFSLIQAETGIDPVVLKQRSEAALKTILHNYSDLSITTIDKFVHRIVRSFTHELQLPWGFETQLETKRLFTELADILLSQAGTDPILTDTLIAFCFHRIDEKKGWKLENSIIEFSESLLNDNTRENLDKFDHYRPEDFRKIRSSIHSYRNELRDRIQTIGKNVTNRFKLHNLSHDDFAGKSRGIFPWFNKLPTIEPEAMSISSAVKNARENNKWAHAQSPNAFVVAGLSAELDRAADELLLIHEKDLPILKLLSSASNNLFLYSLLKTIKELMEKLQSEKNQVVISEFNRRISAIVMNEPIPFIYERTGERYHHFMIDEFQDTSELQFLNLVPLIENGLSSAHSSLIVGDGKQAIYRWRGGEVEQFRDLPAISGKMRSEILEERQQVLERNYKGLTLEMNFRSRKNIVKFNNDFFRHVSSTLHPSFLPIYSDQQQTPMGKDGGYVEIEFCPEDADINAHNLLRVQLLINQAVAEGYHLRDIAIICRKNKKANLIADHLQAAGIPVLSSDSLLLGASEEIRYFLNFLKLFNQPDDRIAYADCLKNLFLTGSLNEGNYLDLLSRGDHLNNTLSELRSNAEQGLYNFLLSTLSFLCLNHETDAYLSGCLDSSWKFISAGDPSLGEYIEWLEQNLNKISLKTPDDLDAVKIMTIHASKGLEFPVVIFPFANWTTRLGEHEKWVDLDADTHFGLPVTKVPMNKTVGAEIAPELYKMEVAKTELDDLNLLYVALTRPEDRLYIITTRPEGRQKFSACFTNYLSSIQELQPEKNIYSFGVKSIPEIHFKEMPGIFHYDSKHSSWQERYKIAGYHETNVQAGFGILFHHVFSSIKHTSTLPTDLNKVFLEVVIEEQQEKQIRAMINQIINIPGIEVFFDESSKVLSEREIILGDGTMIRPDHVAVKNGEAFLLDVKTGDPDDSHHEQVEKYAVALRGIGFHKVRKYLLYTEGLRLVELN